jgi:hypothetical protein
MKYFKIVFSFLFLTILISCGGRNEPEEKNENETHLSQTSKEEVDTLDTEPPIDTIVANSTDENNNTSSGLSNDSEGSSKNNIDKKNGEITVSAAAKKAEAVINSPLRDLLNNGQLGKSYTKKELIEQYRFPKEAVDLIKQVTYVGPNKLYFKWGNTWIAEKVSDAEFENDTLIFTFKQNKTYVSGGAIGIKYNKKLYTDLILNNGAAYIPTVKGYHWDIGK